MRRRVYIIIRRRPRAILTRDGDDYYNGARLLYIVRWQLLDATELAGTSFVAPRRVQKIFKGAGNGLP